MGVEYFDCPRCSETICDCGEFYSCDNCYKSFCVGCYKELSEKGFELNEDGGFYLCCYCTDKKELRETTDEEFIEWLVKISGKTKDDYIKFLISKGDLL